MSNPRDTPITVQVGDLSLDTLRRLRNDWERDGGHLCTLPIVRREIDRREALLAAIEAERAWL